MPGFLAAAAPSLIGGGLSLLGNLFGNSAQEDAAQAALQASRAQNVFGPGFSAVFGPNGLQGQLSGGLKRQFGNANQAANMFGERLSAFDVPAREAEALARFRAISQPQEEAARNRLRSRLFQQGRLGLGVTDTQGLKSNPEQLALESAIQQADLARQMGAFDQTQAELMNLSNLFGANSGLAQQLATLPVNAAQTGIAARTPQGIAAMAAGPGMNRANMFNSFFSSLGGSPGLQRGLGELFGGGAGVGSIPLLNRPGGPVTNPAFRY